MPDSFDRYGWDVLASARAAAAARVTPTVDAELGLVVEIAAIDRGDGWVGAVVRVEKQTVELEDRHGRRRVFPLAAGFLVDGVAVQLRVPSTPVQPPNERRTASGSVVPTAARARVARASRIFVEGRHDAELVEKVWGADLRVEGVVVEYLEGIDHLTEILREVQPSTERRIGVLVDHLVPGSKESRIASQVSGPHVLVVGHPFVDVWQAVKPSRLGIQSWPTVPRSIDGRHVEWKHGICTALGWPHADQADIAAAWQRILASVRDYRDLEPAILGRVEQLIDFTTL